MKSFKKNEKGQVLVIVAAAMITLLVVIGLAIDGTLLFLNYTRLKRAVDAAAVAAANDFKRGSTTVRMKADALEILKMHQFDTSDLSRLDLNVYICDANGDGVRDANLQTEVPDFYNACPNTSKTPADLPRKLVYVRARQYSPTYFVSLIGIGGIPISTDSIAEAAPVDLVIVLDTSNSMGSLTPGYNPGDFNPAACNANNTCKPLNDAKAAANSLIDKMYPGYDRVSVVTFDTMAITRVQLTGDLASAKTEITNKVVLHYDTPMNKLFADWYNAGYAGHVNPVDPEDRNMDGQDSDTSTASTQCTITDPTGNRWDTTKNIPCDDKDHLDAFDWDQDGHYSTWKAGETINGDGSVTCLNVGASDECLTSEWVREHDPFSPLHTPRFPMSLVSTCSGCGIREANFQLTQYGRPDAVWVVIFLSDGVANMSDTYLTNPYNPATKLGIPAIYPDGFCGGRYDANRTDSKLNYWDSMCTKVDKSGSGQYDLTLRYCINDDPTTCPPNAVRLADTTRPGYTPPPYSPPYSPEDYARDMTDRLALRSSANPLEKPGNDVAIYSIGFGDAAAVGAPLLRYMAAVGDDGDRRTDPCKNVINPKQSCGQYYYAQNASDLLPIFDNIASRIYTKISE